ncbi:MAG: sigma-70 family RNA polymerase sigma factor [Puia sp.]|nr:sigma-70 family RNA polymerase sigma factor [Puia sp.]
MTIHTPEETTPTLVGKQTGKRPVNRIQSFPQKMNQPIKGRDFVKLFRNEKLREFESLHRELLHYAYKYLENIPDSQEIVSEAFIKLITLQKPFSTMEHVRSWLFVVVRNACIDVLREKIANRKYITHMEADDFLAAPDDSHERYEWEERYKLLPQIVHEIKDLSPRKKAVLSLYYFQKKTYKEISSILNIAAQTARNHKTEAINEVRAKINIPEK